MAHSFLCPLLVWLDYILIFSSLTFASLRLLVFPGGYIGILHISVSLPPDKLADIHQLALSLLQTQHVTICQVMYFLGKANFCVNGHFQLWRLCHVIQSDILTVYDSPTHLFSSVHYSFLALHQLEQLSHLQQNPVSLQYPLPDVVIATNAISTHWAFYFQVSGLPLLVSGSWSGSMCRAYLLGWLPCIWITALQKLMWNQGGTISPFLSRLACWILSLTNKHSITLIPAYIPTYLNMEASYLSWGQLLIEWHLLPQMTHVAFHLLGLPEVDLLASSHTTQCQHYSTLETLPVEALG